MRKAINFILMLLVLGFSGWVSEIEAQEPVVRILLFYSETCPHCEDIINNFLPGIQEKYGDQLEVKLLDISEPANFELALSLEEVYGIPEAEAGIPEIFIGHTPPLIGSYIIREQLDGLIQEYLDAGGVDFPTPEQLALLVTPMPTATPTSAVVPTGVVRILLFHSPTCPHCEVIINDFLPGIQEKYGDQIEIKLLDISDPYNHGLLVSLEEAAEIPSEKRGVPMIFVGQTIMVGDLSIKDNLEEVIDGYLAEGGADYPIAEELLVTPTPKPAATPNPVETALAENHPIHVAYFYQVGCQECSRVNYALNALKSRYPQLTIECFDIGETRAKMLNEALSERYGVLEGKRLTAPMVFIGHDYLQGNDVNASRLQKMVERYTKEGTEAVWESVTEEELDQAAKIIAERFRTWDVLAVFTVLGYGLLDGLNPCAFATIVFFISYLSFIGRKGREVLIVGVTFTLGIFLTYLLVGMGLLNILGSLEFISAIGQVVYLITAILCLILAVVSFLDFLKARRGRLEEMTLRLPLGMRRWINRIIRTGAQMRAFVAVAFITGLVISLIELACTGQVYLPTIIFVLSMPGPQIQALLYLVLYNLAFIVPLVIVFIMVFFGTTSEQLGRFINRWTGPIKLLMAVMFFFLAFWLMRASLPLFLSRAPFVCS
jgi:cytochrome c biogenesis protein CcdA/thiol-disulfide isomerase/thioredoxin